MSKGTPLEYLPGEKIVVNVHTDSDCEATALLHPLDYNGVPVRCALTVTNYRVIVRPVEEDSNKNNNAGVRNKDQSLLLPLMSIASWGIPHRKGSQSCGVTLWHGQKDAVVDNDAAQRGADELLSSGPLPPLAQSTFRSIVYSLKISSKHIWELELLLHGGRLTNTLRHLYTPSPIASMKHIKDMPAFELYRMRYHTCREGEKQNSNNSNHTEGDDAAGPFDNVEFGWNLHDTDREMQRQLCLDPRREVPNVWDVSNVGPTRDLRPWFRLTSVKQPQNTYGKSPTYPFRVIVPNAASDELLEDAMTARSHARFPAVSFVHLGTGAVLSRASQPLRKSSGLRRDGDLCYMLANSGYHAHNAEPKHESCVVAPVIATGQKTVPPPSLFDTDDDIQSQWFANNTQEVLLPSTRRPRRLLVADCRPRGAAYAHYGLGAGYESGATHDFCEVKFHGIENMHSICDSFTKLKTLVQQFNGKQAKEGFFKQLHDTNWLYHIQRILICSNEIAEALDRGDSSLVHCTDGWDRTSQCTATAMLLLDPFYRTILGFCVLVEKEFCSFGHKFAERCGHQVRGDTSYAFETGVSVSDTEGQSSSSVKLQPSPIFVQWIDVVFQVLRQFPQHFEFTTHFLEYLSEEVYSCLYGTFLCNGEKERMFEGVRFGTSSIWTDLVRSASKERSGEAPLYFVNDTYDSETAWQYISKQRGSGIYRLSPNCSSKRLVFWESFYLRHDGDNYPGGLFNGVRGVKKKVVFQKDWESYFDEFVRESCVSRKKEVEEMQLRPKNVLSRCSTVSVAGVFEEKNNFRACHQCRQKLGIFSLKEQCRECNMVMCGSCAMGLDKEMKICHECHKRREWNKH